MKVADIHSRMVRDVFLNLELMLNDSVTEIAEYDVQALMFLHLRKALANTSFSAGREREGKVDCVLYKEHQPVVFYEIKSYFKKREQLNEKDFVSDIGKLRALLEKCPNARAFFFIAGKKSKFKDVNEGFLCLVESHIANSSLRWQEYELPGGTRSKLRPSQKQTAGRSIVASWEVKLA